MSYDLAVFDPSAAPRSGPEFTDWYTAQTEWEEPHNYDDPTVSTPPLRAWVMDIIQNFPAMNGPYAQPDTGDDDRVSDYSVGCSLIYVGFRWSEAQEAYGVCRQLAAKHAVGFIDASGDEGEVWFPDSVGGGLVRAFSLIPDG